MPSHLTVSDFFLLFSGIIFLGWLGQVFFDRTRIPDVLLLIGLGVLFGPILGLVPPGDLRAVAPYFGTLALVVILFEGGLRLNLKDLIFQFAPASTLTLLAFGLTSMALAAFGHAWLGLGWGASSLLGFVLSGAPSGVIALPVVQRMTVPDSTRTVVSLEAGLSDIFSILAVVMALNLLAPEPGGGEASMAGRLLATFSLAGITAVVVGLGWLAVLNLVRGHPLSYMLTLAVLFLSYAFTEKAGGSGALAVLLTGAVVANAENAFASVDRRWQALAQTWGIPQGSRVRQFFNFRRHFAPVEDSLLRFNGEVSFIVRTFFFVFLGAVAQAPAEGVAYASIGVAFLAAVAARAVAAGAFVSLFRGHRRAFWTYLILAPRGLAAAVLAYLPLAQGVEGASVFPQMAFGFIVLSNLVLTLGVPAVEHASRGKTNGARDGSE